MAISIAARGDSEPLMEMNTTPLIDGHRQAQRHGAHRHRQLGCVDNYRTP